MTEDNENILALLNDQMGGDVLGLDYSVVIAEVTQLSPEEKTRLLATCVAILGNRPAIKDTDVRVSIVRTIVALLPLSLETVADLLGRFSGRYDYEIQFTLFCYLDWAQEMDDASSTAQSILPLVENYFMRVPRDTARAVWMAGDMLGDHWNEAESIPLLTRTARTARYAVGREGSLLGLEKALLRLPAESSAEKEILETLRGISLSDRSGRIRQEAQTISLGWRKKRNAQV